MADNHNSGDPGGPSPEPPYPTGQQAAMDWITIWQSELSALAMDREAQEAWHRWIAQGSDAARTGLRLLPPWPAFPTGFAHDSAGPTAPPGATPPVVAPDSRDDVIRRLADRIAKLERDSAARDPAA